MSRARAEARTTAQIVRNYQGPPLLSFGFRMFFLLAAAWSAVAVPLWIASLFVRSEPLNATVTRDWHVHEMLFGYTSAVIAGYLIVAGANWTGRYPVAGRPLAALGALWLAGRFAVLLGGGSLLAGIVDSAFLLIFAAALWREQVAAPKGRNLVPCIVVTALAAANIVFHLRDLLPAAAALSERLAMGGIALLIATLGGRLVPSFTRNWLAAHKLDATPPHRRDIDRIALLLACAGVGCWILSPDASASGFILALAGTAAFLRLLRWQGWRARREPLVWILHVGYAWVALGLLLLGLSILFPAAVPSATGVHALTAGGIGVMTLALMTRTALSHTGRARRADGPTVIIYALINAAAAMRALSPLLLEIHLELLALSAACWGLAFGLFVVVYGPILCRPVQRLQRPPADTRELER